MRQGIVRQTVYSAACPSELAADPVLPVRTWFVALLLLIGTVSPVIQTARAQSGRLVPLNDWSYEYIERLQRRGYLLELHPTALPYTQGEVASALKRVHRRKLRGAERHWVQLLEARFDLRRTRKGTAVVGGWLEAGAAVANNDRLDPVRPTATGNPLLELGDARIYPNAALHIYLDHRPVVAEVGLQHDVFFDVDPDGLDAVNRLYVRNEHAYVGLNTRLASLYLGRFGNHWAPAGSPGVLISGNPRNYDVATLRLGGTRLALRSMLAELDAANPDGTFTGRARDDLSGTGINRYLAAHRLDWRPRKSLAFSLSESALYSGPGAAPSLKFASPVHVFLFLIDNRPKNEEHNGFFAASAWAHKKPFTGSIQVLLDDFDFINGSEPASIATVAEVHYAATHWLDLSATAHVVTALTYNTHQPEGRYLYLMRGIASEYSDFVQAGIKADFAPTSIPALSVAPHVQMLWQGEGDIMNPFPPVSTEHETILLGTVAQTVRAGTRLRYQPDPRVWVAADLGWNWVENEGNWPGVESVRFVGLFEFGVRLSLNRRYGLDWKDHR